MVIIFECCYKFVYILLRLFAVLIAAIMPNLAPVISLFGAVFFSMLGLFCPAIIHLVTFWENNDEYSEYFEYSDSDDNTINSAVFEGVDVKDIGDALRTSEKKRMDSDRGMNWWTATKDIVIVLMALSALVSGAYSSLMDIFMPSIKPP